MRFLSRIRNAWHAFRSLSCLVDMAAASLRENLRRTKPCGWDLKVTTPDGTVLDITTADLEFVWRYGDRSTDGFLDILQMPRLHLWVRPSGHVEPDRSKILDGTAALPDWMSRSQ